MKKDGRMSFETQLKIEFYHRITAVKNACKNPYEY